MIFTIKLLTLYFYFFKKQRGFLCHNKKKVSIFLKKFVNCLIVYGLQVNGFVLNFKTMIRVICFVKSKLQMKLMVDKGLGGRHHDYYRCLGT